jgi:nucleoside-diphosphate-sugar epimerase
MNKLKSILVTGGAGYIGSVVIPKLVEQGYSVTVYDSLIYGKDGISDLIKEKKIELIIGDIRNYSLLEESLENIDCVLHLAAIVGEPLCKKIPDAAHQINELSTSSLIQACKKQNVKRIIYASTCSNYGSSTELANETTPVQSLSLYSETKVKSESMILNSKNNEFASCVLRFATAFGLSPRMRFDLLLQELIRDAIIDKKIVVFGPNYWRPLVHVDDIANACLKVIESSDELISGEIFNVGENEENYTKIKIAELIQKYYPATSIEIQELKVDPRNYRVSFDKIKNNLGFSITKTVSDGIQEILDKINNQNLDPKQSEFSNMCKMTEQVKAF